MIEIKCLFGIACLVLCGGEAAAALPRVITTDELGRGTVLTTDTKTVVDLTNTPLVKEKNLLDCDLRIVGKPPHYKLVYSLGEISVPTKAVKEAYGDRFVLGVKGQISGISVSQLHVHYRESEGAKYELTLSYHCESEPSCYADVAYEVRVSRPERVVRSALLEKYDKALVVNHEDWEDVERGALMVRDRPDIVTPSPDGLPGDGSKKNTVIYYVCATEKPSRQ